MTDSANMPAVSVPPPETTNRLAGVVWILIASCMFTVMGVFTKFAVAEVDAIDVVFWRSVVVGSVAFVFLRLSGVDFKPGNPRLILWRSAVGLVAMQCFFWSLKEVSLGQATILLYTAPLFTVLLSRQLLGERRQRGTIPVTSIAFVGIVLIVGPSIPAVKWGTFAALASGFLAALAYLAVRKLRSNDTPSRIVFWFSVLAMIGSAPFALHDGLPHGGKAWGLLLGVGLMAAGGQLSMTRAYRFEKASVVAPLSYLTVVLSYLLGFVFWSDVPTIVAAMGVLLVVSAGVWMARSADASAP